MAGGNCNEHCREKACQESSIAQYCFREKKNAKSRCVHLCVCVYPLKALGKTKVIRAESLDIDTNLCHLENARIKKMA